MGLSVKHSRVFLKKAVGIRIYPFCHIRLVVVVAPKEVPVPVLLVELPCYIGVWSLGVFPQHKATFVVKQDRVAYHIALIFFQNTASLS